MNGRAIRLSLVAVLTIALFAVSAAAQDASSSPPGLAPKPGPRTTQQAESQLPLSETTTRLEQAQVGLLEQFNQLHAALDELIRAHERAPDFSIGNERQRQVLFKRMLEKAIEMGKPLVGDAVKLHADFDEWRLFSGEAAKSYRQAEAHFKQKANESVYDEERTFYLRCSKYYAARAARLELILQDSENTSIVNEVDRVKRLVAALEELCAFVEQDGYTDSSVLGQTPLSDFMQAFKMINETLDQWATTLMADIEEEKSAPPEPPPTRPASLPGPTATGAERPARSS